MSLFGSSLADNAEIFSQTVVAARRARASARSIVRSALTFSAKRLPGLVSGPEMLNHPQRLVAHRLAHQIDHCLVVIRIKTRPAFVAVSPPPRSRPCDIVLGQLVQKQPINRRMQRLDLGVLVMTVSNERRLQIHIDQLRGNAVAEARKVACRDAVHAAILPPQRLTARTCMPCVLAGTTTPKPVSASHVRAKTA